MSYILTAFIGPAATLNLQHPLLHDTELVLLPLVKLPQSLAMLPVSNASKMHEMRDVITPFSVLTKVLSQQATDASSLGKLGYFEIEMFGGQGNRCAILWDNRQVAFGTLVSTDTPDSTEALFTLLGVQATNDFDRFAALGLGQHRRTEEWLYNA